MYFLPKVFINFAKEQMDRSEGREKDSETVSLIQRLQRFGRTIRNTFANRPAVHFSSLWTPGARNQMQCESFMEEDDTLSIQFPGSDVSNKVFRYLHNFNWHFFNESSKVFLTWSERLAISI